jgi:hypothetical protein
VGATPGLHASPKPEAVPVHATTGFIGADARPNWREHGRAERWLTMRLDMEQHRALAMLADAGPRGCAESIMAVHFGVEILAGLTHERSRHHQRSRAGS